MNNRAFSEIRKHLGFGLMRLPMKDGSIDNEQLCSMVDRFLERGFNYFDTAHCYHDGLSEVAVRECLSSRHDRSEYILTNKLTEDYFNTEEEIRPLIDSQLEICGVDYFDFLLMHAQNARNYEHFRRCRAYETAFELKAEGKVRHVGLSFHDKPEVLDRILNDYPEIEIVQIQFNYFDYESLSVESRRVYEVCRRHGKPVLIMEPVRGGNLVNLPEDAQKIFDELRTDTDTACSNAGYALRFAAGFDGIEVVLSGMSDNAQMEDNLDTFSCCDGDFAPLSEKELEAVWKVADVFSAMGAIPCTECRYCIEQNHCPMEIRIPSLFKSYNGKLLFDYNNPWESYEAIIEDGSGRPSDCIGCGMCEAVCPQHLEIRELLKKVAEFYKDDGRRD